MFAELRLLLVTLAARAHERVVVIVDKLDVAGEAILEGEIRRATRAVEWSLFEVDAALVLLEVTVLAETARALVTLVGPQALMNGTDVLAHVADLGESMATYGALAAVWM